MRVAWSRDSVTVRDVLGVLSRKRELAYTTIMTVMGRLADKGLLIAEKRGKTFTTIALLTPEKNLKRKLPGRSFTRSLPISAARSPSANSSKNSPRPTPTNWPGWPNWPAQGRMKRMKVDRRSHFLLALFGLVAACASACVSQSLISGLLPLWAVCWQAMKIHLGGALWLSLLARLAILALAAFGSLTLLRRLWKTQRFVSGLNAASATAHPARLAQLCSRLNLSTRISVLATDVPLAFCVGLLRPRICLSAGLIQTFA